MKFYQLLLSLLKHYGTKTRERSWHVKFLFHLARKIVSSSLVLPVLLSENICAFLTELRNFYSFSYRRQLITNSQEGRKGTDKLDHSFTFFFQ